MDQQQAESTPRATAVRTGSNGVQASEASRRGDDFLSMLNAVSALLDDVTVPGARPSTAPMQPKDALPTVETSAPVAAQNIVWQPEVEAKDQPPTVAASAPPSKTAAAESEPAPVDTPVLPMGPPPGATAWASGVQVNDDLRPPWEMEERTTFDAAQQPTQRPAPPPADVKPAWAIPASLFEPIAPAPVPEPPVQAAAPVLASDAVVPDVEASAITIRGKNQGVSIEIGAGPWPSLMIALGRRLDQAAGFFRGGHVAVDVGARPLTEPELKSLYDLLKTHNMDLGILRTVAERTFQSALALGISATHETMEGPPAAVAQRAATNEDRFAYFVYRGNLRSGQVLDRRDHVVVIGDVNPGAEVISDGDIMVWGRLRGVAHAGARGNVKSIVAALELEPVQLRINTTIAAAPGAHENGARRSTNKSSAKRAEIARLVENRLVIEPWDEARTMGSPLLKRLRE